MNRGDEWAGRREEFVTTRERRLADLLESWRDAERELWLLLNVDLGEAEQRVARARAAYERALRDAPTVASSVHARPEGVPPHA
jgi:hypothetical protein